MRPLRFAAALLAFVTPAFGQTTLRIGIGADPNVLDPAQSSSFVERVVFSALCDKLVDVGADLSFQPELATAWQWAPDGRALTLTLREGARFHDGAPIDAAAVKANLDRYRTARESRRRSELAPVAAVEAPDARTVRIVLREPFAPLLSVLSDRAGMMLSPAVLPMAERIGENPVCSGIINQVALEGRFIPSNQPEAPGTAYHFPEFAAPARDPARARALLRAAGHDRVAFTFRVPNQPLESQVAQIIQAMAAEAGFDIKLEVMEAATMVAAAERGDFEATMNIWSGRADPDGNISFWLASDGFLNRGRYANDGLDALFREARAVTDTAARQRLYRDATRIWMADRPLMILYHYRWFWAMRADLAEFEPRPDGIIRLAGLRVSR